MFCVFYYACLSNWTWIYGLTSWKCIVSSSVCIVLELLWQLLSFHVRTVFYYNLCLCHRFFSSITWNFYKPHGTQNSLFALFFDPSPYNILRYSYLLSFRYDNFGINKRLCFSSNLSKLEMIAQPKLSRLCVSKRFPCLITRGALFIFRWKIYCKEKSDIKETLLRSL